MMITTSHTRLDVETFTAAVRKALDDLSRDEIDELTDGLEADLLERAEDDSRADVLGDPDAYADELRQAAGLQPRGRGAKVRPARSLARQARRQLRAALVGIRGNRLASGLLDFAIVLRPAWWLVRGWVAYELLTMFFGVALTGAMLPLLLVLMTISVQWGRGRWLPAPWLRVLRTGLSIVSVIALPLLLFATVTAWNAAQAPQDNYAPPRGLTLNGSHIWDIFAYDAKGVRLQDVQLYDQDGNPIVTVADTASRWDLSDQSGQFVVVPNPRANGQWNVFPLSQVPVGSSPDTFDTPVNDYLATPGKAPFETVRPLSPETQVVANQPAPTPSATP